MMPSPVNLSTVPPKRCTTTAQRFASIGHDFAQSLSPHGRGDVHRMHDVEQ